MPLIARAGVLVAAVALVLSGCAADSGGRSVGAQQPRSSAATTHVRPATSAPASAPATEAATSLRTPCRRNRLAKYVFVSIRRQHMWMCARHRVARDAPVTSGIVGQYTNTPTGRFEIQSKVRDTWLTLIDGSAYRVKYWIPFDGPLFGFHDSSWQDFPYGGPEYRTRGSHGCVHMPLRAIRFLYHWGDIGTSVRIQP